MTTGYRSTSPVEALETRTLLSALPLIQRTTRTPTTAIANLNLSKLTQNQTEGAIAVDPANPNRMFAFSNEEIRAGMMATYSADGGRTWTRRNLANGADGLPSACCDPSAVFDEFGNLFIAYMQASTSEVVVAQSSDGGASFHRIGKFTGDVDQPTITAAKGGVWVMFSQSGYIRVASAQVNGLDNVGAFSTGGRVPSRADSNFGDIAVGPDGQVMVVFQSPVSDSGPSRLYTSVDPDGLGPAPFGAYRLAGTTNIGGFTSIPAQPKGEIDAEAAIVYDRSNSIGRGRVYMIFTGQSRSIKADTSIAFRYSNNNGSTWSPVMRLDNDRVHSSQFLPRLALDQSSGDLAVTWLDTRNDAVPARSRIDSDGKANTDAELFGILATPTARGIRTTGNFKISRGASNARLAHNSIDFGDYQGLAFQSGKVVPLWSDNSNSTRDNPNGRLRAFDIYIARINDPFA